MDPSPKDVTTNEEKELRRVYDHLASFQPKSRVQAKLSKRLDRMEKLNTFKKNVHSLKVMDAKGRSMTEEEADAEIAELQEIINELQDRIAELSDDPAKKITANDLQTALRKLGRVYAKKEVEEMIWEVDENLDEAVDWSEFRLMFERNIKDTTGLEPFQLFNVVQFLMYDKDLSGKVTLDETMHMLYQRYGKQQLESKMRSLFGDNLATKDGDGELSFDEYVEAVSVRLPKQRIRVKKHRKK
eukprot:TRINITY_DN777939_c0_g1_i1.p1 TRINITY_DN777939_c0_g1~~TRINITY_DN777939_c0_g1_i1.p1  ORF type:complete len:243 (-),score=69.28 TRINITY_DN777939_c0_g1_i1:278-1006(-)